MKNKWIYIFIILLFLVGLGFIFYPLVVDYAATQEAENVISEFQKNAEKTSASDEESDESEGVDYRGLYEDMQNYNKEIYENGQANLMDPFSYETPAFDLSNYGIKDNVAGYIEIPKMDVKLPIYLGATQSNLALGAGCLGGTSTPIGGINTNTVLAAHRGYKGIPMFRDIEALKPGDKIYITNLWETMTYEVVETAVILPTDIEKVKIQENRNMVTLVTCHPYTKNYQRYIVYCERTEDEAEVNEGGADMGLELKNLFKLNEMTSSQRLIFAEKWIPVGIIVLLVLIAAILLLRKIRSRK